MVIKEFNDKYNLILELIENGELGKATNEFNLLKELYNSNKRNDLYFKLRKVHKNLNNYSLIKKAYELK